MNPPSRTPRAPAPPASQTSDAAQERAREFAISAARLLADDKCEGVIILDVRRLSPITDFLVIGTGTSDRQMRSVLVNVEEAGGAAGFAAFRTNRDDRATWLLADFVDVVVHVFEPNARAHYDLEMLWGDAVRVEWARAHAPARAPRRSRSAPDEGTRA